MSSPRRPLFVWTATPPHRAGHYWFRESFNHEESIVEVYREEGEREWSVSYGPRTTDTNWLLNMPGEWGDRAIPLPVEIASEEDEVSDELLPPPLAPQGTLRARQQQRSRE